MKKKFTTSWKKSTQVKKQRKYRRNAPLHIKQKFMHVHLSPELRKKHHTRSTQLRTGDKVKVLRGTFKKKEGKVERINLKKERVFITGIEKIKKEGTKLLISFRPSNLMITLLDLENKKRKQKLEPKEEKKKEEIKKEAKEPEKKEEEKAEEKK